MRELHGIGVIENLTLEINAYINKNSSLYYNIDINNTLIFNTNKKLN